MSSCQSKNAKRDRSVRVIFRKGFKVRPHSEQSGSSGAQFSPGNRASPQLSHQPRSRSDVFIFNCCEQFHSFEYLSSHEIKPLSTHTRPRRDTGQSSATVSLSIHFPNPRADADGSPRLHTSDSAPPVTACSAPPGAFRLRRPTAFDSATKGKLRRLPPSVFPWNLFLSPGSLDADGSAWTPRTVLHTSTNRSTMPTNCAFVISSLLLFSALASIPPVIHWEHLR